MRLGVFAASQWRSFRRRRMRSFNRHDSSSYGPLKGGCIITQRSPWRSMAARGTTASVWNAQRSRNHAHGCPSSTSNVAASGARRATDAKSFVLPVRKSVAPRTGSSRLAYWQALVGSSTRRHEYRTSAEVIGAPVDQTALVRRWKV